MKIGYARVSTSHQDLIGQKNALHSVGCERIYEDVVSGTRASRPGWDTCLDALRPGDQLVVTKLDRAGRSLKHLLELDERLRESEVSLVVIDQGIDTSTSAGRAMFQMLGVFAEFERALISERTKEGLRGRPRGRSGGRPIALSPTKKDKAQELYDRGELTVAEIAAVVKVSERTLYRYLETGAKKLSPTKVQG